ncbi:MAG: ThiF family adenylyltransferase, partial [Pseudomonadota bacterium]
MAPRHKHHLLLPEIGGQGQQKLAAAKVLIVGAGGLGCPILAYLAAAGVGHLTICDDDKVELSNLQRQILYTEDDIGELKALAAA